MFDNIESLTRVLRIIALSLYTVISCVLSVIPNNPVKVGFQILASILYFSYQAVGERIIIRSLRSLTKWNIKNDFRKNREVYFSSVLPSIHEIYVFCEQPANLKKDSDAYFYIRKWIDAARFITGQFVTGNSIDESQVLNSIEYYRNDIMYKNELKKGISLLNNTFNKLIKNKETFFAVMSGFTDSEKDKLYDVCNKMNRDMENATK